MDHYGDSLVKALNTIYPDIGLDALHFKRKPGILFFKFFSYYHKLFLYIQKKFFNKNLLNFY